jgi:hypothetical protein
VTSRELIHWSRLHARRATPWWSNAIFVGTLTGIAIAAWVGWRASTSFTGASHAWVGATIVAFAIAFVRVPFHLYWRGDASLLAQLPIEGTALFDAALVRCIEAAVATTAATVIGALPLLRESTELGVRHLVFAGSLGIACALLLPAVATGAAALVAAGQQDDRMKKVAGTSEGPPSAALLGALPGFAATFVIVDALVEYKWLVDGTPVLSPALAFGGLAAVSIVSIVAARSAAPRVMGTILRDVSALDRQRLAHLEIRPPTAIERVIAILVGNAALAYSKDARLMRRRYPMAFALGSTIFIVLAIIGIAVPDDPLPWLTVTIGGAAVYAITLAHRLHRKPIELERLSGSLPITESARNRAKLAWLLGWWVVFVAVPGVFAVARQADVGPGFALLGAATVIAIAAAKLRA